MGRHILAFTLLMALLMFSSMVQADPVMDIARESEGLLNRFPDHPLKKEGDQIRSYYDTVLELAERTRTLYRGEDLCLVNTEVNSGNFLIGATGAYLVDWEKAVASYRYQDLGFRVDQLVEIQPAAHVIDAVVDIGRQRDGLDLVGQRSIA